MDFDRKAAAFKLSGRAKKEASRWETDRACPVMMMSSSGPSGIEGNAQDLIQQGFLCSY